MLEITARMQAVTPDVIHSDGLRKALKKIERMGVQNNYADVLLDFKVGFHAQACSTWMTHRATRSLPYTVAVLHAVVSEECLHDPNIFLSADANR
jgi:hypothetical protein